MEKMFSYTPVQSQVQINSMPMINTKSKAAEAFDSISSIVSSVGNAYVKGKEMDYQQAQRQVSVAKAEEKEKEELYKQQYNQLELELVQKKLNINKALEEGKVEDAFNQRVELENWSSNLVVEGSDKHTVDIRTKGLTAVADYRSVFTEINKKEAAIKADNKIAVSLATGIVNFEDKSTFISHRVAAGDSFSDAETSFVKQINNQDLGLAQQLVDVKDLVGSFNKVQQSELAYRAKMKELKVSDNNSEVLSHLQNYDKLKKEIAETQLSQLKNVKQSDDAFLFNKVYNETVSLNYFDNDGLFGMYSEFYSSLGKKQETARLNKLAINSPFTTPISSTGLTKETRDIMGKQIVNAFVGKQLKNVATALKTSPDEARSYIKNYIADQINNIGSMTKEQAITTISNLKGSIEAAITYEIVAPQDYADIIVAESIIQNKGSKDFYEFYKEYKTNQISPYKTGLSESIINEVYKQIPNDTIAQKSVLTKLGSMSTSFNVTEETVRQLTVPYQVKEYGTNRFQVKIATALGMNGGAEADKYLNIFLQQMLNKGYISNKVSKSIWEGGYTFSTMSNGDVQITNNKGQSTIFKGALIFDKKLIDERNKMFNDKYKPVSKKVKSQGIQSTKQVVQKAVYDKVEATKDFLKPVSKKIGDVTDILLDYFHHLGK